MNVALVDKEHAEDVVVELLQGHPDRRRARRMLRAGASVEMRLVDADIEVRLRFTERASDLAALRGEHSVGRAGTPDPADSEPLVLGRRPWIDFMSDEGIDRLAERDA